MSRRVVPLLLLCFAPVLPVSAQLFPDYLTGSISLQRMENSDLYSAGEVTCYTYFGSEDFSCTISGTHYIYDAASFAFVATFSYQKNGEYVGYVRSSLEETGHCYRATLSATAPVQRLSAQWGSSQVCYPDRPPPPDTHFGSCPILIDLGGKGFPLSGTDDPVFFDLNADGVAESTSWTQRGSRVGFLCLDRNHNGRIDDGRELFGEFTPLAVGGLAQISYTALAEFDLPEYGGNFDGFIDEKDEIYNQLCVWVDSNHDGISQPGEILTLKQAGVVRLDHAYSKVLRRDEHGNLFRYKSKAWISTAAGKTRVTDTYDVYFVSP